MLCNFVFDDIFIWNHLPKEHYVWIFSYLKFKFFKWIWMEKRPKLEKLLNFIVDNLFIWIYLARVLKSKCLFQI